MSQKELLNDEKQQKRTFGELALTCTAFFPEEAGVDGWFAVASMVNCDFPVQCSFWCRCGRGDTTCRAVLYRDTGTVAGDGQTQGSDMFKNILQL